MAHVEGKVTSYQVINGALNNAERVGKDEAQSIELGLWRLLMSRPDDVSIGHAMFKTLQKLPQDKRDELPPQVKEQCAKFEKASAGATSAVFTMSAPRVAPASAVTKPVHPMHEQLSSKVATAKVEPSKNGSSRPGQ